MLRDGYILFIISHWALAWEGDYEMHPVCAYMHAQSTKPADTELTFAIYHCETPFITKSAPRI